MCEKHLMLAGTKAGRHQQRPQIADVVVHLVVVHLDRGAQAQPERRQLEIGLPAPRRHVDQRDAARRQQPPDLAAAAWAASATCSSTDTIITTSSSPDGSAASASGSCPSTARTRGCCLRSSASATSTSDGARGPVDRPCARTRPGSRSRRRRSACRRTSGTCAVDLPPRQPDAEAIDQRAAAVLQKGFRRAAARHVSDASRPPPSRTAAA